MDLQNNQKLVTFRTRFDHRVFLLSENILSLYLYKYSERIIKDNKVLNYKYSFLSMAYNKNEMVKQCLEAIQEHDLVHVEEIVSFVSFSERTFYYHKLQELQEIKKAIKETKVKIKQKLRKKWFDSKSPVLQIALYRLLATEYEYERLTIQRIDHTSGGDKIQPINVSVIKDENVEKYKQHLEKLAQLN